MFRTIVVPLDGTPQAAAALPVARAVARATEGELVLVRVASSAEVLSEPERYLRAIAREFQDVRVDCVVRQGKPAREIIAAAAPDTRTSSSWPHMDVLGSNVFSPAAFPSACLPRVPYLFSWSGRVASGSPACGHFWYRLTAPLALPLRLARRSDSRVPAALGWSWSRQSSQFRRGFTAPTTVVRPSILTLSGKTRPSARHRGMSTESPNGSEQLACVPTAVRVQARCVHHPVSGRPGGRGSHHHEHTCAHRPCTEPDRQHRRCAGKNRPAPRAAGASAGWSLRRSACAGLADVG